MFSMNDNVNNTHQTYELRKLRIMNEYIRKAFKKIDGASLVAQWLRICLPMQGTRVRAPVWEDPTCHGATGPVSRNY